MNNISLLLLNIIFNILSCKGIHPILGQADVWHLLLLQRYRPSQHAHRHDVKLVSKDLNEVR